MRRLKISLLSFVFIFLFMLSNLNIIKTYALDTKISFSDPETKVGSDFNVVLKIQSLSGGNLGNANLLLKYDPAYIEFVSGNGAYGGQGTIKISALEDGKKEWVYNMNFKALKDGQTKVEISSDEIYDVDGKVATISHKGSSTISIAASEALANDASLSSLSVENFQLDKAFSPEIEEYSINVAQDINSLNINPVAKNNLASIEISGNESFADGENRVEIKVVSADKTNTKTYVIKVIKNSTNSATEDPSKVQISVLEKTLYLFEPEQNVQIPKNLSETEIEVNDKRIKAWVDKEDAGKNFVIIYGKSADTELGFYSYDLQEKTIQRYFNLENDDLNHKYKNLERTKNIILVFLIIFIVLTLALLVFIIYIFSKNSNNKKLYSSNDIDHDFNKNIKLKNTKRQELDLNDLEELLNSKSKEVSSNKQEKAPAPEAQAAQAPQAQAPKAQAAQAPQAQAAQAQAPKAQDIYGLDSDFEIID